LDFEGRGRKRDSAPIPWRVRTRCRLGGKESVEATIRALAGFQAYADRVTGSKEVRAVPFAAQVQGGNVWLLAGPWQRALLEEMESFPNGRRKDQVDACSRAFIKPTGRPIRDLS
jgi:predicted phage terminase large subunit-like protein